MPPSPIDKVVGFSNGEAMALLVRTLATERGYRRFGYIGGTTERDTRGNLRKEGFLRALSRNSACRQGRADFLRHSAHLDRTGRAGDRLDAGALAGYRSRPLRFRPFGLRRVDGMSAAAA